MAFRPDSFIISILIFSFIIAVGSGFITDMATNYDVEYDDEFGSTYLVIEEAYNLSSDQKDDTLGGEIEETDVVDSTIKGATSALKLLTTPVQIVSAVIGDVEEKIGPEKGSATGINIRLYVTTALTVLVTFALIYLFFRIRSW